MKNKDRYQKAQLYWDQEAASFDDEPDHGLKDANISAAWRILLKKWLPQSPLKVLDIGCGTGSLSVLLAGLGHYVTGIDISPAMIYQAKNKASLAGQAIQFHVMEATNPRFSMEQFDGILCRHLLWSLSDPAEALEKWVSFLKPGGRILLIEGFWYTGSGLHMDEVIEALPTSLKNITTQNLSNQPAYWGRKVDDERFAITAELRS